MRVHARAVGTRLHMQRCHEWGSCVLQKCNDSCQDFHGTGAWLFVSLCRSPLGNWLLKCRFSLSLPLEATIRVNIIQAR